MPTLPLENWVAHEMEGLGLARRNGLSRIAKPKPDPPFGGRRKSLG